MPSLGMITVNALAAADSVIIPVQAHYLPAKGMTQLIKTITKVKKQIKKICLQPVEISVIRKSLFDWRNREVQAENDVAVEVIGELLAMVL